MPRGSEELTQSRKNEIIAACEKLYETMSFKEISIREIGKATSFTRTSIYNYFQTKEEIFLAILEKEYREWNRELLRIHDENDHLTHEQFAATLAHSLEERSNLLKLMSMNHYDMEENSRMENLVEFKKVYGRSLSNVDSCLKKFFPQLSPQGRQDFIFSFFPFMFGIYPYTTVTEKQRKAMTEADVNYVYLSIYEITYREINKLLSF